MTMKRRSRIIVPNRIEQLVRVEKSTASLNDLDLSQEQIEVFHAIVRKATVEQTCIMVLLSVPAGTDETFAAEVLANAFERPLYRVDLGLLVSKYIGETEKNLNALFDAAHDRDIVLLFDEDDSLFGKRSEVNDSHDRYANIEINYLLQRMEEHEGLMILATNLKDKLDPAFLRRINFVVDFPISRDRLTPVRRKKKLNGNN